MKDLEVEPVDEKVRGYGIKLATCIKNKQQQDGEITLNYRQIGKDYYEYV